MCQSTKKCVESIKQKKVMLSNNANLIKVKQYRLLKAHKKGFDVSHLIDENVLLRSEYKEIMRNKQINDVYIIDNLKTNWNNDVGALFILLQIYNFDPTNPTHINKVNLRGNFGTYQMQCVSKSNSKSNPNLQIPTNSIKEFVTTNGTHFRNQLLVKANYNILDVYDYNCGEHINTTYYIQISNKDIAKRIFDFNAKCFKYLLNQLKQSSIGSSNKINYHLSSSVIVYNNKLFEFAKKYDNKGNSIDTNSELDSDFDFEISNKPLNQTPLTAKDFHKKYLTYDGIIIKKVIPFKNKRLQTSLEITNTGVFLFRDFLNKATFGQNLMGISVNIY
jgi:hypothetical protein